MIIKTPIAPEKVELIKWVLTHPDVYPLYEKWINMPMPVSSGDTKTIYSRQAAFRAYAYARDAVIGLPNLDKLPKNNGIEKTRI